MRSLVRKFGVAIVLALAAMSVTVASASATLPELSYEFPESVSVSGGQIVLESGSESVHGPVTCTGTSGTGSMTGYKLFAVLQLRFTGCTTKFFGVITAKCTSSGLAEGEITTSSSQASLVYIAKATREVGVVFNYGGKASTVASFSCGTNAGSIRGEFMAKITPVNTITAKFPLTLTGAKGTPQYAQYEGESGEKVSLSALEIALETPFEKANFNATGLTLVFTKGAEIKA